MLFNNAEFLSQCVKIGCIEDSSIYVNWTTSFRSAEKSLGPASGTLLVIDGKIVLLVGASSGLELRPASLLPALNSRHRAKRFPVPRIWYWPIQHFATRTTPVHWSPPIKLPTGARSLTTINRISNVSCRVSTKATVQSYASAAPTTQKPDITTSSCPAAFGAHHLPGLTAYVFAYHDIIATQVSWIPGAYEV